MDYPSLKNWNSLSRICVSLTSWINNWPHMHKNYLNEWWMDKPLSKFKYKI
jgi:hypothetical protein